jgi:hypothetical protein
MADIVDLHHYGAYADEIRHRPLLCAPSMFGNLEVKVLYTT